MCVCVCVRDCMGHCYCLKFVDVFGLNREEKSSTNVTVKSTDLHRFGYAEILAVRVRGKNGL